MFTTGAGRAACAAECMLVHDDGCQPEPAACSCSRHACLLCWQHLLGAHMVGWQRPVWGLDAHAQGAGPASSIAVDITDLSAPSIVHHVLQGSADSCGMACVG
jgi:hypothetical protein